MKSLKTLRTHSNTITKFIYSHIIVDKVDKLRLNKVFFKGKNHETEDCFLENKTCNRCSSEKKKIIILGAVKTLINVDYLGCPVNYKVFQNIHE